MCESHGWLHSALSKPLFLPYFYPRNSQPKNEGSIPLNSPVERGGKWFSVPFLDLQITAETQPSPGFLLLLSFVCYWGVFFFTYTSICPRKKRISDMTSVWVFFPGDLTVHFFLGRARVSFKSFSPGFLRNLSVWHVCHFSQSSSESWQFSHNGICWQVVRADSEYVWKTVKLVKKN